MSTIPLIFGQRSFIGFIKYYDQDKKNGYIACNNYGMENSPKFQGASHSFYFDQSSTKAPITKHLVVFQLVFVKGKTKAINVRDYDKIHDRKLVLSYIFNRNFIFYTKKETKYSYKTNRTSVRNIKISILSKSGICRYEIIRQVADLFIAKGEKDFLCKMNKMINAFGGDKDYYTTLHGEYKNKAKEEESIKYMFEVIGEETTQKLVIAHPCFQMYAPSSSLLSILDQLDEKYGIPQKSYGQYKEAELTNIILRKEVFNRFYNEREKRKLIAGKTVDKGDIERMLDYISADNVEHLCNMINQQMLCAIENFVKNVSSYPKQKKIDFLRVYDKFINNSQREVINDAIENDVISDILAKCFSFGDKESKTFHDFGSFVNSIIEIYSQSSEKVQKAVVKEIEKTLISTLKVFLISLAKMEFPYSSWEIDCYERIHKIVSSCEFINREFGKTTHKLLKNFYLEQFEKLVLHENCTHFFLKQFDSVVSAEERFTFSQHLSKKIIENESLRIIYYYHMEVLKQNPPLSLKEIILKKTVEQVVDCGIAFSCQKDRGFSLINTVFNLIFNNTDVSGNFIIDNNPEGLRSHFLGYFISHQEWDNIRDYMWRLSYHDRVILSLSKQYGLDMATSEDIKRELLSFTSSGNVNNLLDRLRNCKFAIVDIIEELSLSRNTNAKEVLSWVRLFLSIKDRHYYSKEQKESTSTKLLNAIHVIENRFDIRFSQYGIDTENKCITPCYTDLSSCDNFIQFIWRCKVSSNGTTYSKLSCKKECIESLDDSFIRFIELLMGSEFVEESRGYYSLPFQISTCKCSCDNILAYITINVLNNIQFIQDVLSNKENVNNLLLNDLRIIDNPYFEDYISGLINMTAKNGMSAFWRVGDRGDIETYYTDVVMSFKFVPLPIVFDILKEDLPELMIEEDSKTYSYHKRESEIASGYGRSHDWDNDLDYKDSIIKPMIKKLFLAYKKGLFIIE